MFIKILPKMATVKRPNVLIILADDLGFSDLGCFGGEIETPYLDQMALEGTRFTDFHAASACSPTRSMLLSGTDHHIAGIGSMAERMTEEMAGKPGYEGYLNDRIVSFQEVMRDGGYETLMSGKWHLGLTPDRTPHSRGFERSFSLLNGCHNHYGWEPAYEDRSKIPRIAAVLRRMYNRDGAPVAPDELPKGFYSTDSFTDTLLDYLKDRESRKEERPFFAYLPFSAPHWPLQAPPEVVNKYNGKYDKGWDALRTQRIAQLKELGLVPENAVPAPVISKAEDGEDTKHWDELTADEKTASARKMEVYAGMVDRIDFNVGRVIEHLKATGQYDSTIVMFFSDNGAEGAQFEAAPLTAGGDMESHVKKYHDNSLENMGAHNSFIWYGARWASASTAPGLLYKMFTSEGGIRVPFIIRYPELVKKGGIDHSFSTVMDIMPTVLDICGVKHPGTTYEGREVAPVAGATWLPYLKGDTAEIHAIDHVTGWELFGRRAVRQGGWKALYIPKPYGPEKWQLFNILDDPGETKDLAEELPEKMSHMVALYEEYCKVNGVINQSGASRAKWSDTI
ncbi:arylsulfatase [Thozetella sp. PMI_491]|nr:arylsulfatase [Thozetella sp. PMI_491]